MDTILLNGPVDKRINMVYLGDGYTQNEMTKFVSDVNKSLSLLFETFPLNRYRNYFNVFAIEVVSPQSGIKHPRTAGDCPVASEHGAINPNNYFGTTFDFAGIHRLVVPQSYSLINQVLATNFPQYDQALIIANTSFYGGSGGDFATATAHQSAPEIMIHEIGHSFALLADEYWAGSQFAREMPNMTQQKNQPLVKWKNWLGTPNIGIFPHTGDPNWFKPSTGTCKMEMLFKEFCSVCTETFIERIHQLTNPIESFSPNNNTPLSIENNMTFKVKSLTPLPNTLRPTWTLNGVKQTNQTDSLMLNVAALNGVNHTLQYSITDTTLFSRADNHQSLHTYNVLWNINKTTGISEPDLIEASLQLYPNPTEQALNVSVKFNKPSKAEIRIVSMDGREVYKSGTQWYLGGSHQFNIDLNNLKVISGTYIFQLVVNGNTITKEFIRLR
ncbi:MAG: T9SS type A sorting domain-containing protein [Bacteroidetes bacterium]|nr:T9SS type A sorting domain-containing protein [Bacteroidota bacterium]